MKLFPFVCLNGRQDGGGLKHEKVRPSFPCEICLSTVFCMGKGNEKPIQHIIALKQQFPLDVKTQPSVSPGDVSFCRERNCK